MGGTYIRAHGYLKGRETIQTGPPSKSINPFPSSIIISRCSDMSRDARHPMRHRLVSLLIPTNQRWAKAQSPSTNMLAQEILETGTEQTSLVPFRDYISMSARRVSHLSPPFRFSHLPGTPWLRCNKSTSSSSICCDHTMPMPGSCVDLS